MALPVALACGVASGMGAAAGLYSVIAVGFFASVFGGTRSQISGPTGPMTIAMAVIITTHASTLPEALTVVIMGGLLQILLGSGATYIDDSAAMSINRLITTAHKEDTQCIVMGLSGAAAKTLHTLDVLRDLPDEQVVKSKDEAREVAIRLLGSDR